MALLRQARVAVRLSTATFRPFSTVFLKQICSLQNARPSLIRCVSPAVSFHSSPAAYNRHVINIQDEEDFKTQVLDSQVPVIVDFHATWCGPCKLLGPRLETLVAAHDGDVILAKVDIDELTDIAMEHEVSAVPTVIGMKGGKVQDSFIGVKDDDQLTTFIRKLTGK